jgi:cytidylate kinase
VSVVTVSRQFGAGGQSVAPALARALGFQFVDREVVEEAARRLGVDPEVAMARDERTPAIVEEIGMALAAGTPPLVGAPLSQATGGSPSDSALADATRTVILSLANRGGYVILGRGAQAALGSRPDACHLALVGDLADRTRRVAASRHLGDREARSLCERIDAERAAYVRRFYGVDIRDSGLYDCVLNTSRLGVDGAIAAALEVVRGRLGVG